MPSVLLPSLNTHENWSSNWNVKIDDHMYAFWSVLSHIYPVLKNAGRISGLEKSSNGTTLEGIHFHDSSEKDGVAFLETGFLSKIE